MNDTDIKKVIAINSVLAEWDPLGCQLEDFRYPYTEYDKYIYPIIEVFKSGSSVYEYLIELKLNLFGGLNEELRNEIKEVAQKISHILSN
jgi:hypothetical protein